MMDITFDFPPTQAIPIAAPGAPAAAQWAASACAAFVAEAEIPAEHHERLERALTVMAGDVTSDSTRILLVGMEAAALAPLKIVVAQNEFSHEEQAQFLWSPSAVLPPAAFRVESEHAGVGISSTLLQRDQSGDFGTKRWMFFGEGMTIGAVLGPVPPYLLAVVEPLADQIVQSFRAEGFVPSDSAARVDELVAAVVRPGDEWQV